MFLALQNITQNNYRDIRPVFFYKSPSVFFFFLIKRSYFLFFLYPFECLFFFMKTLARPPGRPAQRAAGRPGGFLFFAFRQALLLLKKRAALLAVRQKIIPSGRSLETPALFFYARPAARWAGRQGSFAFKK
jgi:hypothetical protein